MAGEIKAAKSRPSLQYKVTEVVAAVSSTAVLGCGGRVKGVVIFVWGATHQMAATLVVISASFCQHQLQKQFATVETSICNRYTQKAVSSEPCMC
jgi:hypothetical protein